MNINTKQLDNFKLTGVLNTNYACSYSPDDRIFITSSTGIYIITIKCDLKSTFPMLSCRKDHFKFSKYAVCDHVGMNLTSFVYDLPREVLYESVLRFDLSANLPTATPVEITCVSAEWSPLGLVGKTQCLLAVLTNIHGLELYAKFRDECDHIEYCSVINITEELVNFKKPSFKYADKLPGADVKFNEFKRRVEQVAPNAFVWGHITEVDNVKYAFLFVGHLDSSISVWKIKEMEMNTYPNGHATLLGIYKTQLGPISAVVWNKTHDYGGGLCFGDINGKMSVLSIKNLNTSEAIIDSELAFCTDVDKAVDKLLIMFVEGYTCIVMLKQSYVFFYSINSDGEVTDHAIHDIGNLYITGIYYHENVLLALTFMGVLKKLTVYIGDGKLLINETIVPLKHDWSSYRPHGFFMSQNKVLVGAVTCANRLKHENRGKQYTKVIFYNNSCVNPFSLLMNNSTGTIRFHWDCLEVLRLLCIKEQRFPWLGIDPNLVYDNMDLTQLKTLRLIAKLSETLLRVVPRITSYNIKSFILMHYLVQIKLITSRLRTLLSMKDCGQELSLFQMRSIDLQSFFLKEMVLRGILAKAKVGKVFIKEIKEVMLVVNNMRFPDMPECYWCGEKLIGQLCLPPHVDSRCVFSMMQIPLVPAFKCPICGGLAHENMKLESETLFCPYCDVAMEKRHATEDLDKVAKESFEENNIFFNPEKCYSDCLEFVDENFEVECDRNSETDHIVLISDDSDEDDGSLRTLYFKTADMSIEQIFEKRTELMSDCDNK